MYTDEYRLPFGEPVFLHCCPYWLHELAGIQEVADGAFWAGEHNLSAIYNADNPMPSLLKRGIKIYTAGYNEGLDERFKKEDARKQGGI
jgi:hypothetical protein